MKTCEQIKCSSKAFCFNYNRLVDCSIFSFICYNILEPFFKGYANKILILTSILLLIAHHVFAYIFNLYHRAWSMPV